MSDLELAIKHRYRTPNGTIAPSVTTITGMLDDNGKSSRMAGAAAKLERQGLNYRAEWAAKATRGTRVHGNCEAWLRGEDAEVLDSDQPYLDALAKFFIDKDPMPIEIERVVLSDRGFGGRFDFIARFDGLNTLVDVKTGRKYPLEHCLQLAAYSHADGMAVWGPDGNLDRLQPLPPIDRAGDLYLSDDGTFEFVEYPINDLAFAVFTDLLAANHSITKLKEMLPK